MTSETTGYTVSLIYVAFGIANITFGGSLEMGLKVTGLILSVLGAIHLCFKIRGTHLDNQLKENQLEED